MSLPRSRQRERFFYVGRFFIALLILGVSRYSVWFLHEQYEMRAKSLGKTDADFILESEAVCRMVSMHDWPLDVVQPAHAYFQRFPTRRDALVQTVTTLEAALLLFNVWLFVFHDLWIIIQTLAAFFSVLAIQCLWWSPMPCGFTVLPDGQAWVSDLLAGGNVVFPLGGISGSTVFVTLALYNVWRQRRQLDTAFFVAISVVCYVLYHLVMRWRYSYDELCSVLLAAVIIHQIQRGRLISRLTETYKRLEDTSPFSMEASVVSTPTRRSPQPHQQQQLADVLRAYQTEARVEAMDDNQFTDSLPERPPLHDIPEVYHE